MIECSISISKSSKLKGAWTIRHFNKTPFKKNSSFQKFTKSAHLDESNIDQSEASTNLLTSLSDKSNKTNIPATNLFENWQI